MPLTFKQFKDGFDFTLEAFAVAYGLWYKFDMFKSWFDIVRGRATSAEQTLAAQTWREATPSIQMILECVAHGLEKHGHREVAERIRNVGTEATETTEAQNPQPSIQMTLDRLAQCLEKHGRQGEAERIRKVTREATEAQNPQPEQMV